MTANLYKIMANTIAKKNKETNRLMDEFIDKHHPEPKEIDSYIENGIKVKVYEPR